MAVIKIKEVAYILPEDQTKLDSVLNHLDMTIKGVKSHIKLFDLDGNVTKFTTTELQTYMKKGEIDIRR